ncbi:hypothetical protein L1987_41049 [Smallanthus sonchifolius]|uniref:Uncharacterized protein n=1 Tax=Smallanthus sonchifolius TaxID=185202 RepID=A0ACB9GVG4_9ASTR|nr:hypothetical protein L1987_41049 [Smallanthus sonchifolius]
MVLDDSVRRLFAAYESRIAELESLVQTLDEERLLKEEVMNRMHFRINDLEVAGVTTGQRLQALEDRAGVTEVGLLTVQQQMSEWSFCRADVACLWSYSVIVGVSGWMYLILDLLM